MAPGHAAALLFAFALVPACKGSPVATTNPAPSASVPATPSHSGAPTPSASAPPAVSASAGPPVGAGVATWAPLEDTKECATKGRDLEPNLAFGGIAIAAHGKDLAVAWHYVSGKKGEGLVAFSGYDAFGRTLAVAHGIGKGSHFPAQIFPRGGSWLVTWFDAQSLLFAKTSWAPNLPNAERLNAITADEAGETAILATKGGLVGVAALGPGKREQLGLFLFAPEEEGADPVKAIGSTRHASVPEHPAAAEIEGAWLVAWDDELAAGAPRSVVVSRLDVAGKESEQETISTPGRTATRPSIAALDGGALIAWVEQDGVESAVVVRRLDAKGRVASPTFRVGQGAMPTLSATKDGALLSMLRAADGGAPQVAAVRVAATGTPAPSGRLVSDLGKGKGAVSQPAGVAYVAEEDRLGFVFTYSDGMRGQLKTAKVEGCF